MSTTKTVKITWTDGTTSTFKNIPADLDQATIKQELEKKHNKKIHKIQDLTTPTTAPAQSGAGSTPGSQTDRNATSQPKPDPTAPSELATLPSGQRDDTKDYRANFPDKFTPKNMRRNKWGELIYE
jgi:hypothetical protein